MDKFPSFDNAESFAKYVVNSCKVSWVNGTFPVGSTKIGIKAYGKWVQIILADNKPYTDSGQFTTQKAMREFIINFIEG